MRKDADWEWEQLLLQMYMAKHMAIDLTIAPQSQQISEASYQAAFQDWRTISHVWGLQAILAREARRNAN